MCSFNSPSPTNVLCVLFIPVSLLSSGCQLIEEKEYQSGFPVLPIRFSRSSLSSFFIVYLLTTLTPQRCGSPIFLVNPPLDMFLSATHFVIPAVSLMHSACQIGLYKI